MADTIQALESTVEANVELAIESLNAAGHKFVQAGTTNTALSAPTRTVIHVQETDDIANTMKFARTSSAMDGYRRFLFTEQKLTENVIQVLVGLSVSIVSPVAQPEKPDISFLLEGLTDETELNDENLETETVEADEEDNTNDQSEEVTTPDDDTEESETSEQFLSFLFNSDEDETPVDDTVTSEHEADATLASNRNDSNFVTPGLEETVSLNVEDTESQPPELADTDKLDDSPPEDLSWLTASLEVVEETTPPPISDDIPQDIPPLPPETGPTTVSELLGAPEPEPSNLTATLIKIGAGFALLGVLAIGGAKILGSNSEPLEIATIETTTTVPEVETRTVIGMNIVFTDPDAWEMEVNKPCTLVAPYDETRILATHNGDNALLDAETIELTNITGTLKTGTVNGCMVKQQIELQPGLTEVTVSAALNGTKTVIIDSAHSRTLKTDGIEFIKTVLAQDINYAVDVK